MRRAPLVALAICFVLSACEKAPDASGGSAAAGGPGPATASKEAAPSTPTPGGTSPSGASTAAVGTPVKLPSGIEYTILKAGEGPSPKLGAHVRLQLTGRLRDGQVFLDTRAHGVPREYRLDRLELISGLVDQLLEMRKGERRSIHIPSDLAYGAAGYRGQVPGGADLDLDVELVGFGP